MSVTRIVIDTTGRGLVGTDLSDINGVWGEFDESIKVWLGEICNPVLGTIAGGSGYTDGTYTDVPLVRDTPTTVYGGRDMLATVVISGNVVTNVTITHKGNGFATGDVLIFDDVADVGGTGADFEIPVTSADASIGLIYDPDQRDETDEEQGWMFGVERPLGEDGSYTFGVYYYKISTVHDHFYGVNFYNWTPSSSNNSYGTFTSDASYGQSWDETDGDGYKCSLTWCSDPDERMLVFSDNKYTYSYALFQTVRGTGNYPDTSLVSTWATSYSNAANLYLRAVCSVATDTPYVGNYGYISSRTKEPMDDLAVITGHPVETRSLIVGAVPNRIGTTKNAGRIWGATLGVGDDEWRYVSTCCVIRESDNP